MEKVRDELRRIKMQFRQDGFWGSIKKLLLSHTTPHKIAMGAAIGLFFSIIPTPVVGMFIAIFFALLFRFNVVATYIGTVIVNPFTATFFYGLNYFVGNSLIGSELRTVVIGETYFGGVIVGLAMGIILYVFVYGAVILYYKHHTNIFKGRK